MTSVMLREINEQPDAVAATIAQCLERRSELRDLFSRDFRSALFIARGTSDSVADFGQYLLAVELGIIATSASPSIATAYGATVDLRDCVAIAISQSGSTLEIVETARWARDMGATVLAITNVAGSPLAELADLAIVTPAGRELAVPATKSYTTAVAALIAVAAIVADDRALEEALLRVPQLLRDQLRSGLPVDAMAAPFLHAQTAVFSGRGFANGAAREAALKLKETSGINAIGSSMADLVHGPIAALNAAVPLVILSADAGSPVTPGLIDLAARARAKEVPIIVLGDADAALASLADLHVPLQGGDERLAPLNLAIPTQLLAERVARLRGFDPDAPTGLSKVTQTR